MPTPLLFAHRGYAAKYPENTILAFTKALEYGADGLECDVQLSADGRDVVFHDTEVDRLTDGQGKISSLVWSALEKLRIKKEHRLPGLTEVLLLCRRANKRILVELKDDNAGDAAVAAIRAAQMQDLATVISFNPMVVARIARSNPDLRTGLLLSSNRRILASIFRRTPTDRPFTLIGALWQLLVLIFPISIARIVRPDIVLFDQQLSSRLHIRQAHYRGFLAYSWTVNDPMVAGKLAAWGIDGIITDEVEKIKEAASIYPATH